jgi:ATP-dependent helicase/nuclease subunit A
MKPVLPEIEIVDAKERLQALDIKHSYCVQAPAGSGKTELLTQRILRLLAHCDQPEEILAFTFTRKASAEMRNRLLASLLKASKLKRSEVEALPAHEKMTYELAVEVLHRNQQKNWHLLENTQRLRITTIDAFNAYITSQLPIISAFGSQPEISKDMDALFEQAIQETLSYLDIKTPIAEHIAILLQHLNNNLQGVQSLLLQLLRKRDQWLSHILSINHKPQQLRVELEKNLSELIEENLQHAESQLQSYASDICQLIGFAAQNLAANGSPNLQELGIINSLPTTTATQRDSWKALADFFLTARGELRKSVTIKNGFPKPDDGVDAVEKESFKQHKALFKDLCQRFAEQDDIKSVLQRLQTLPDNIYQDKQWQILSALTAILPFLVAHLNVVLKQQGQVDYVQVSSAALEALGSEDKPTDLSMRFDYQIKHILVDEFQDTSSLQSKLLEKLTWGWEPDDGRTLFIVGDGMQSCYGFRNANVGLFLAARDNGIGEIKLDSLQLKTNFRSEKAVVNWVNTIFSKAFPATDDISRGAVAYSQSEAIHIDFSDAGVETQLWIRDKEAGIERRLASLKEAEVIAKQCLALSTAYPESSIAILVRNRSHLREIVPALRAAQIQWNARDIDSLTSYSEINDLLCLLKALLNLADKTAMLALLRTPFIGLGLEDIHQISLGANSDTGSLWQTLVNFTDLDTLSEDASQRLQLVMPILVMARERRQQLPLRDWLEGTWVALGGPATLTTENDLSYIDTFLNALENAAEHNDILDIHHFEDKLSQIYVTGKHDINVKLQIMTIHNAKGLEFDFVLVPGLDRTPRANDKSLLLWKEHLNKKGEDKLLLSLLSRKGDDDNPTYLYMRNEEDLRSKMENTRLLYIAITRAAKKTFLYGQVQKNKDKLVKPASTSLLHSIWAQIDPAENEQPETVIFSAINATKDAINSNLNGDAQNKSINIRRLPTSWVHPLRKDIPGLNLDEPAPKIVKTIIDYTHHNLLEKKIGDIIHYCLKLKVEKNFDLLNSNNLIFLSRHWQYQLKPVCATETELSVAIETIKLNLKNCMEHSLAPWIFDHSHTDSACELALSDYRQAWRQESIIDRTFIDTDNTRWIIDYKSSRQKTDQNLENFCQEQVLSYKQQLDNYVKLFNAMEDRPVKTALFFTAIPHWLETSI